MAKEKPWYVRQRAQALAYVFLTNEPDVAVVEERGVDFGLDYRLVLNKDFTDPTQWVGVEVMPCDSNPPDMLDWGAPGLSKPSFENVDVPIFVLVVNARDEQVFFAWLKEPLPGKSSQLKSHLDEPRLRARPIDRMGYREVLEACRGYFEKRSKARSVALR